MKLLSFKIENFRSIKNTECHLGDDITVLAGKNESGKTSILDALQLLNDLTEFSDSDEPLNKISDESSRIIYDFEFKENEKEKLTEGYVVDFSKLRDKITISLNLSKSTYSVYGPFYDDVLKQIETWTTSEQDELLYQYEDALGLIHSKNLELLHLEFKESNVTQITQKLDKYLEDLPKNPKDNQQIHPDVHNSVSDLRSLFTDHEDKGKIIRDRIWKLRPKIVLFSSFDDLLPASVPFGEFTNDDTLKNNYPIVHDLITLAKLDVEKLNTDDRQLRENLTAKASKITTEKFDNFWEQNPVEFKYSIDEPTVSIFVKDREQEGYLKPEQRSKGFQWFLSFYLRLEAQANIANNIILIDEPGLYLHAKAQQNVLNVLEDLSKKNQVVYTTHSPYLIDPDNLQRVRLVIKDEKINNTVITRSFHTGGDADTLTPIITAIGLDISRELFFSKDLNIVMEGISDYYYSQAMLEFIRKNDSKFSFPTTISFIPCMGHTTIGLIVSLLMGMDLKFKVMFDRKDTKKSLNKLKNHGLTKEQILVVGKDDNDSIEELFSKDDQKQFLITGQDKGKVLISRIFYENVKSGHYKDFSATTINNFRTLFDEIKKETHSIGQLEKEIDEVEKLWDEVAELLTITHSLPISQAERKKLITKFSKKIKSLKEPSLEQKAALFNQFLQELGVK